MRIYQNTIPLYMCVCVCMRVCVCGGVSRHFRFLRFNFLQTSPAKKKKKHRKNHN